MCVCVYHTRHTHNTPTPPLPITLTTSLDSPPTASRSTVDRKPSHTLHCQSHTPTPHSLTHSTPVPHTQGCTTYLALTQPPRPPSRPTSQTRRPDSRTPSYHNALSPASTFCRVGVKRWAAKFTVSSSRFSHFSLNSVPDLKIWFVLFFFFVVPDSCILALLPVDFDAAFGPNLKFGFTKSKIRFEVRGAINVAS